MTWDLSREKIDRSALLTLFSTLQLQRAAFFFFLIRIFRPDGRSMNTSRNRKKKTPLPAGGPVPAPAQARAPGRVQVRASS
jgi:hypothetical protein